MSTRTLETDRSALIERYIAIRSHTETLASPLSAEDQCVQSMADASPTKWHRAHTTWFFETFVLLPEHSAYRVFDDEFCYLFNSYYEAVGERHSRPERGLLTRPSIDEVQRYRTHVDAAMIDFIETASTRAFAETFARIDLGLHHEQQHQELLLMDIKHALSRNRYAPRYTTTPRPTQLDANPQALGWFNIEGGIVDIGAPSIGFSFDNEGPMHTVLLQPFSLGDRLTTAGEYLDFINDGGYERPDLWLSDGWGTVQRERWQAPLYWERNGSDDWTTLTMRGREALLPNEPVMHVSHYEADAFARWAGARLATEFEWECAASQHTIAGNLLRRDDVESVAFHPTERVANNPQIYGDVWEWTSSAYLPYPRFAPAAGAIGEYNGKFMANQMVLRGGSCFTPHDHIRPSYRNFFYPHQRWMASGIRLARDSEAAG